MCHGSSFSLRGLYWARALKTFILMMVLALGGFTGAQSAAVSGSLFSYSGLALNAGGDPPWLSFERGKRLFGSRDFGIALEAFDNAIVYRRELFSRVQDNLQRLQQTTQWNQANDSINALLLLYAAEDFLPLEYKNLADSHQGAFRAFLQHLRQLRISENHRTFIELLLVMLDYRPLDSFDDSLRQLGRQAGLLSRYPEAEYWKGRVFAVEGETSLAELQYRRAIEQRESLEIPEDVYRFQYALADLYKLQANFNRWQEVLGRLLVDDPITGDPPINPFLRDAMLRTLVNEGFDKFMTLYRLDLTFSLQANFELAIYLLDHGRTAVLHSATAVCMILTRAIQLTSSRDRDYSWQGLAHFFTYTRQREDVRDYLANQSFYQILFTLADALYVDSAYSNRAAAQYLWQQLFAQRVMPWSGLAEQRIRNPQSAIRR